MHRCFGRAVVTALVVWAIGSWPDPLSGQVAPPADTGTPAPLAADSVAKRLLVDVRGVDSTILVDARYAGTGNFTGAVLPGYHADKALLRREAAKALARVQHRLASEGLGLKVFDGYRPVRATQAMASWARRTGQAQLLREGYIALHSRHNLGIAVDLTLVNRVTGLELNMGTPFDTFSEAAHTANAEGRVRVYRTMLVKAMESEGFKNYEREWWHFSFPIAEPVAFDLPIE
jgi:D-alanyl-D-alanine dipeptidase